MQGRDSVKFLQGFTTNNITELVPGAAQVNAIRHAKNTVLTLELVSQYTALLNAQGRVMFHGFLVRDSPDDQSLDRRDWSPLCA